MNSANFITIILQIQNDFALIRLNRPESLNSINGLMHKELKMALKIIKNKQTRALLLTGNGKGFCSGQDLREDQQSAPHDSIEACNTFDLGESLENDYNPLIKSWLNLPFPTICAVNGIAAGAGASLALACDIVIASSTSHFTFAFSKVGLAPDSASTWILPRLIGHARAMGVMMLANKITAQQAENWGMIWQQVEPKELESTSIALAQRLAKAPTQSLKHIKGLLQHSWNQPINEQLDLERDVQSLLGGTFDYQEGVKSFIQKRTPIFKGQ